MPQRAHGQCDRLAFPSTRALIRPLPDGRQIDTLLDAGKYITDLPKADQQLEEWQTAIAVLLMAAEGRGPLMHARIGVLRALNRHVVRTFNPDRNGGSASSGGTNEDCLGLRR